MAEIKAHFIEASSDCISETNEYPYAVVGGSVPSGKLPTDTPAAEVFGTIVARHKEVGEPHGGFQTCVMTGRAAEGAQLLAGGGCV